MTPRWCSPRPEALPHRSWYPTPIATSGRLPRPRPAASGSDPTTAASLSELRIVDGEIVVRGDTVGPGYLDDAHDSASAFDDGWFRTGDLGRLDDDGYLFVLGRRDDVVSRGGQLVSLATVEQELEAHPAVSAVLAAPSGFAKTAHHPGERSKSLPPN